MTKYKTIKHKTTYRHIVLVLGDQLNLDSSAFTGFSPQEDLILMIEAPGESKHVPSTKMRTALFLSAMRHFAQAISDQSWPLEYLKLGTHRFQKLADALGDALSRYRPQRVIVVEPGEYRLEKEIKKVCADHGISLDIRDDLYFMISKHDFQHWVGNRTSLLMEMFYRKMRLDYQILVSDKKPIGGLWNYDKENRGNFGRHGPNNVPELISFKPDALTCEVLDDVEKYFGNHYGNTKNFNWPVTRVQALQALDHFIKYRLPQFGESQDAMWDNEPFLYHSLLSSPLNLKLLNPREVIAKAVNAWEHKKVPLAAAEGFIRQIIGWREFMRGVYWWRMPKLLKNNFLNASEKLPNWYWTGKTSMNCMKAVITQTLKYGYAHHIQRLMITGQFAMTFGVAPAEIHAWYLSVYVDAVEWVELPNTVGMSQFADGHAFSTKPYAASGAYVNRMSNYCRHCRYQPTSRQGENACPVTVMYWDFLARHENQFKNSSRTQLMMKNLQKMSNEEIKAIHIQARKMRQNADDL